MYQDNALSRLDSSGQILELISAVAVSHFEGDAHSQRVLFSPHTTQSGCAVAVYAGRAPEQYSASTSALCDENQFVPESL